MTRCHPTKKSDKPIRLYMAGPMPQLVFPMDNNKPIRLYMAGPMLQQMPQQMSPMNDKLMSLQLMSSMSTIVKTLPQDYQMRQHSMLLLKSS